MTVNVAAKTGTRIVTKRGKPVIDATAPPQQEKPFRPLWARTPNVKILGTIMKPLDWGDPTEKWKRAGKKGHLNARKP